MVLARRESFDEAISVALRAKRANIFHFDKLYRSRLEMLMLFVAAEAKDGDLVGTFCRRLSSVSFAHHINLFGILVPKFSITDYLHPNHFRQFCRMSKKLVADTTLNNLLELQLANMALVGKNHLAAHHHYCKVQEADPGNPMSSLGLGVVYLHCAMKRNTRNRNFQLAIVSVIMEIKLILSRIIGILVLFQIYSRKRRDSRIVI